jgi:hypothetical protein
MSQATRQILEKIGTLLKDARPLAPSETPRPDRAEAPAPQPTDGKPQPSLASASVSNSATPPEPASAAEPAKPRGLQSAGTEQGAPVQR